MVRKMGLIQRSHDLIHTKRNNTEHQVCINFLMSAHPQVARSKVVLETAIHPFNHSPNMTHPQEGGTGGEVSEILFFSAKSKRRPSLIYSMQIIPVCLSIVARRKGVSATRRGGSNWTPISLLVGHPCKLFNIQGARLRNTRRSSPIGLHPHWDEAGCRTSDWNRRNYSHDLQVLHFTVERGWL